MIYWRIQGNTSFDDRRMDLDEAIDSANALLTYDQSVTLIQIDTHGQLWTESVYRRAMAGPFRRANMKLVSINTIRPTARWAA